MPEYDEDLVLTQYIFKNYSDLFTEVEVRATQALALQEKSACASTGARSLHRVAEERRREAADQLRDGALAFKMRVKDRVLREHPHQIFVVRCPRCSRILRTPRARQCRWCGYSWHL